MKQYFPIDAMKTHMGAGSDIEGFEASDTFFPINSNSTNAFNLAELNNSVDIYNPKVVRSAMGAHFYLSNLFNLNTNNILHILSNKICTFSNISFYRYFF